MSQCKNSGRGKRIIISYTENMPPDAGLDHVLINHLFWCFSMNCSTSCPKACGGVFVTCAGENKGCKSCVLPFTFAITELSAGENTPLVQVNASKITPSFVPITA